MNRKLNRLLNKTLTCKGNPVSEEEKKILESFLNALFRVSVVYRHVGDSYLEMQYRTRTNNIELLSEHIFLYGDKGKLFYEELDQKTFNKDISEIKDEVFSFIYKKYKKVFVEKALKSHKTIDAVDTFCKKEPSFVSFWSNMTEEEWLKRIDKLDEKEKRKIKDYYVSLLHTVGLAGYGRNSYFLSTSRDMNIRNIMRWQNDGIEIVGWTKFSRKNVITYDKTEKLSVIVKSIGFPIVSHAFFPVQREITYKCGILPHYIVGYLYGKDSFEINPYILKKQDFGSVCEKGLDIDQTLFYQRLSEVGYKSTYIELDDMSFQIPELI
jgi:hypothetical protein